MDKRFDKKFMFRAGVVFMATLFFLSACALDKEALQKRSSPLPIKPLSAKARLLPSDVPLKTGKEISEPYRLGVEDVISIAVLNDINMNDTQRVRPDGKISFFPMGDMQAAGLSVQEVRKEIIQQLKTDSTKPYILGAGDVIEVKVFGHADLGTNQEIRPDGKISIMPVGDVQASGRTVEGLRKEIAESLSELALNPIVAVNIKEYNSKPIQIYDPIVNVTITEYNSRKVSVLGAVDKPGILKLKSSTSLVEGISSAGGLNEDADLKRAVFFRNEELLPVNFEKLFKKGDRSQNILLQANDSIFIPSSSDNRIYVIGEVKKPGIVTWQGTLNYLNAIAMAGGYNKTAQTQNVILIRDGLVEPAMYMVDARSITREGRLEYNIPLETGDVVYVPKDAMGSAERYLEFANKLLQPILSLQSGIILGSSVKSTLTQPSGGGGVGTSINLNP